MITRSNAPPLFLVAALTAWRALDAGGRRSSPPTWVGHSLALLRTSSEGAVTHLAFPLPCSATCLAALLHPSSCFAHRCPLLMSCPKLSDWAKRCASSQCPSCFKSPPAASASETRPRDFPVTVFLREHLAGGNLLRSFPHSVDLMSYSVFVPKPSIHHMHDP
jgi:hypothetical protein